MDYLTQMTKGHSVNDVKIVSLPDACQYIRGLTYNKAQEVDTTTTGAHKVLRANNITLGANTLNFEDVKCVAREVVVKDTQWLRYGDILMCASSGSQEHVGKVAFISEALDYTFGGFMAVIRCKEEVLPRYMFHVLTSGLFTGHLKETLKSNTIKTINAAAINAFSFPLPTLEVQEEIVRILDEYSEKNAQLIDALSAELAARKVQYEYYRAALLQFDANSSPDAIAWKTLPEICENCDPIRKPVTKRDRKEGEFPYYGASGIVDYVDKYLFDGEYLLISEDGANLLARTTPIAFVAKGRFWVNNHAHVLRFDNKVTQKYIEIYFNMLDLSPFVTSAAQPKLSQGSLNKIRIPLPSLELQQRIVSRLEAYETSYMELIKSIQNEIQLRQTQYEYYRNKLLTVRDAN